MYINQNNAILEDSWLTSFYDRKNLTYYDVRVGNTQTGVYSPIKQKPLFMYILHLDENVMTVQRKVFTIFDAFAATGGIMGLILGVCRLMIGGI